MLNIQDKIVDIVKRHAPAVDVQLLIKEIQTDLEPEWQAGKMCSYYGNRPLMFFLLAHLGQEKALVELARKFDVGAADRDGETALDFADEMGDKAIIRRLEKYAGASKEKSSRVYSLTSKKMRMLLYDIHGNFNKKFIVKALERGVNPMALTDFTVFSKGVVSPCRRKVWDNLAGRGTAPDYDPFEDETSIVEISYEQTSLLQEAIIQKHRGLVELILMARKKPVVPICVLVGKSKITDYVNLAQRFSAPGIYARVKKALG